MKRSSGSGAGSSRFSKYVAAARRAGAAEPRIIRARRIVTAEWVRLKCQFGCGGYGKRLCCPPHTPTPEQMRRAIAGYEYALIYS